MIELFDTAEKLKASISQLKKEKNAIILAHFYQESGVQDVADFVGDSLALSQQAAGTEADMIVFAGVHFMAETAKILNPSKKVLLPDLAAGCSLAEGCREEDFRKFIQVHPLHCKVTYINCSAAIKAMSDIICTSSNAVKVIHSIPIQTPILFAPDRNLGKYLMRVTGRKMVLWDGACEVHEAFSLKKIEQLLTKTPGAKLVAHPESDSMLLDRADFIGSTAAMIQFIKQDEGHSFVVATEAGILHRLKQVAPGKQIFAAPTVEPNACACSECRYMKLTTLQKLYNCLKNEEPEIQVEENIRRKALLPIQRMMDLSVEKEKKLSTLQV